MRKQEETVSHNNIKLHTSLARISVLVQFPNNPHMKHFTQFSFLMSYQLWNIFL